MLDEEQRVAATALMALVARRLAPYKNLQQIEFVRALPKTATGKTLRRLLVEREHSRGATEDRPRNGGPP